MTVGPMTRMKRGSTVALAVALLTGCPRAFDAGMVRKAYTTYRVGPVPAGWSRRGFSDDDLAFASADGNHLISVNATCRRYQDAPLEVLTRHLEMGFTNLRMISTKQRMLDGRAALETHLTARMDGVPVELGLVVLKKNGCIYDFSYVSPPGHYEEAQSSFEALLERFHTEAK